MLDQIKFFFSWLWDFIHPYVTILMTAAGKAAALGASEAVAAVAQDVSMVNASSTEKFDAAVAMVLANLETQGIKIGYDVLTSFINTTVEMAYQKYQSTQATVTAVVTPAVTPVVAPNTPAPTPQEQIISNIAG